MSKLIDGGLIELMCLRALSENEFATAYMVEQAIKKATDETFSNRAVRLALNRLCNNNLVDARAIRRINLFNILPDGEKYLNANSPHAQKVLTFIIKKSTGEQA